MIPGLECTRGSCKRQLVTNFCKYIESNKCFFGDKTLLILKKKEGPNMNFNAEPLIARPNRCGNHYDTKSIDFDEAYSIFFHFIFYPQIFKTI